MPIIKAGKVTVARATTPVHINDEAVAVTAGDIATVPAGKQGMLLSVYNNGPASVNIAFDSDASATHGIPLDPGDEYAESDITIVTRVSAISTSATGQGATVRGILWCG